MTERSQTGPTTQVDDATRTEHELAKDVACIVLAVRRHLFAVADLEDRSSVAELHHCARRESARPVEGCALGRPRAYRLQGGSCQRIAHGRPDRGDVLRRASSEVTSMTSCTEARFGWSTFLRMATSSPAKHASAGHLFTDREKSTHGRGRGSPAPPHRGRPSPAGPASPRLLALVRVLVRVLANALGPLFGSQAARGAELLPLRSVAGAASKTP